MQFMTKLFDVDLVIDYEPKPEILWEDIYITYADKDLRGNLFDTGEMDETWIDANFDEEHQAYVEQLCREDYDGARIDYEMMRREALEWD